MDNYGKQNNLNVTSLKAEERTIACNAIILRQEQNDIFVLLGMRANHKSGGGQWGLIGGTQTKGEKMEQTLQRELFEEIGVITDIDNIRWNNFFQCIATEKVHFDHHGFVVDFDKCKGEIVNKEPDKCDELRWFNIKHLPMDNFFVSKGNLINYINGDVYNPNINYNYREITQNFSNYNSF